MTTWFHYSRPLVRVRLLARPNRFLALVRDPTGRTRRVHVPNPGRMEELLVAGITTGWVVPAAPGSPRKTEFTLVAVRHGRSTVSVDTGLANRLLAAALANREIDGLAPGPWMAEARLGHHRLDFGVRDSRATGWRALLEVKSSNLRVGRTALFPDAPTERGRRHLEVLTRFVGRRRRADVLFAVQRDDVEEFRPNAALDPDFAAALGRAASAGVGLHAFTVRVHPERASLGRRIPVVLPEHGVGPRHQPI